MAASSVLSVTPAVGVPDEAGPQSDPTYLYDLAERMHAIEMLSAAIGWLQLFEHLSKKPSRIEQLCHDLKVAQRPALVLLTMLQAQGLLLLDARGQYSLSQLSKEFLLSESRWSLVPCFAALKDRPSCVAIRDVLRSGSPMGWQAADAKGPSSSGGSDGFAGPPLAEEPDLPPNWDAGMRDEAFAEFFLAAIDSRNAYLSYAAARRLDLTGCRALLDIGGGSGIYACALATKNSELHATVLEQAPVDAVARRAIGKRGLSSRVSVHSADMMAEPLPEGFDVHLYSNVIHDWDKETVLRLLRSSFAALQPGGRVVIHDSILHGEPDPRPVAEYSALLVSFTAGRCYSFAELRDLLHVAGFSSVVLSPTAIHRSLVAATKPFTLSEGVAH